jgi:hypothetical protein
MMKRIRKNVSLALLVLLLATFFAVKVAHASNSAHAAPASGLWGGTHVEMKVSSQGATLEFDCAQGTISEPIQLDESGKFQAKGTFQTHAGPTRRDQAPGADTTYSGTVDGDTMHIAFTIGENKDTDANQFTLVRGQPGKLRRCQ